MFNVCDFILQYLIVLVNVTGEYLDCFSNRHFARHIKDSHKIYPTIYVTLVTLTYQLTISYIVHQTSIKVQKYEEK